MLKSKPGTPIEQRLADHAIVTESGCWEWDGSRMPSGYGRINIGGDMFLAHRVSWETFRGPIPPGLVIDHLCRNTPCFNPDHLEPVTQAENNRRGIGPINQTSKTHCPKGHPLSGDNLRQYNQGRVCRECGNAASRAYVQRKKRRNQLI